MQHSKIDDAKQAKVFVAFSLHYGTLWLDRLGDTERAKAGVKRIWQYSLVNLSQEQVQRGVNQIIRGKTEFSRFPPNSSEFVALCENTCVPKVPEFKALPRPAIDREKARGELDKVWKMLGGK